MAMLSGDRRWPVVIAAGGTIMIAAGAFWLSFTALADLAHRSGIAAEQAWTWPLLVDGLIVVSTVAAVALDGHRTAWYPWSLLVAGAVVSVTANALHAVVAGASNVPAALAAVVAAVPPITLLASTHLTTVLIRSTQPGSPPTPAPQTTVPDPGPQGISTPVGPALPAPLQTAPPEPSSATDNAHTRETDSGAAGDASRTDADPKSTASSEVPGGSDRRERAAVLRAEGWSNRRIAAELEVHPSTVGRWLGREYLSDTTGEQEETGSSPETEGDPR
ncbi:MULTISPECIES: DUF2637 domain-containing protein [unclassified Brevibacterium]|uniref:DUF2637 domain-containing protein n=1 Tax=unclassified Brevibacterium TaxID=2614124 RepID=UPI0009F64730